MLEETAYFADAQFSRMTLAVKKNEPPNPLNIAHGRLDATEASQSALPDLIEQSRRLRRYRRRQDRGCGHGRQTSAQQRKRSFPLACIHANSIIGNRKPPIIPKQLDT